MKKSQIAHLARQIDSVVHFESRQVLDNWDKQIQSLCFQVILTYFGQVYFSPDKCIFARQMYKLLGMSNVDYS